MTRYHLTRAAFAATLAALTACQTVETAQTTEERAAKKRFDAADANNDGKLSRDEADDYLVTDIFEARDANHDGKLTWAEWNVEGADKAKERFVGADTNKDDVVTLKEALAYGRKNDLFGASFTEADKNKDGYLTLAELKAYYASKEGPIN